MALFDLIQSFSSKGSQTYNDFLEAYSQVRNISNVKENLTVISACLLSEQNLNSRKCIAYYITHDLDRIILQLHLQFDIEPFFCTILPIFDSAYLRSDFFQIIWKFRRFPRLCKLYCELCVVHNIFNRELALLLVELFFNSKEVREGVMIVVKVQEYLVAFEDMHLGSSVAAKISSYIAHLDERSFELLGFLSYYEDVLERVFEIENIKLSEVAQKDNPLSFKYFINLFKQKQSIRFAILENSGEFIKMNGFSEFLFECLKIDSEIVAGMLCEQAPAKWKPLEIIRIILNESDCNHSEHSNHSENNSSECKIPTNFKIHKFALLNLLIENKFNDFRIYRFLYFLDKKTFFNNFGRISKLFENKRIWKFIEEDIYSE